MQALVGRCLLADGPHCGRQPYLLYTMNSACDRG